MQIILPCFADPFDYVLQGAMLDPQSGVSMLPVYPLAMASLIEGDMFPISYPPVGPIPPAEMVPLWDWYGVLPRQVGPMANEGGIVIMLTVGTPIPAPILVDPILQFLNQVIPQDLTGQYLDFSDSMSLTTVPTYIIQGNSGAGDFGNILPPTFPTAEINISGSLKSLATNIVFPITFGNNMMVNLYTNTTQRFLITGVTKDNNSNPLGNCQVFILDVSRMYVNTNAGGNPIVATGTSDNSGNYSLQVGGNGTFYQVIGYLPGAPDVGGITVDSITPVTG